MMLPSVARTEPVPAEEAEKTEFFLLLLIKLPTLPSTDHTISAFKRIFSGMTLPLLSYASITKLAVSPTLTAATFGEILNDDIADCDI